MDNELLKQLQELRERSRLERDFNPAGFLAERIKTGALKISAADGASFASQFVRLWRYGAFTTPEIVLEAVSMLLGERRAEVACDPWADLGVLAKRVRDVTDARTYAVSINAEDATLGKALAPERVDGVGGGSNWYMLSPPNQD
jgi:hypothetical protein